MRFLKHLTTWSSFMLLVVISTFGQTEQMKYEIPTKGLLPTCVGYSKDGKLLASGGISGKINIFNSINGSKLSEYKLKGVPLDLKFSLDNNYIISGGKDKKVTLFNIQSGSVQGEFKGQKDDITAISVSNQYFASGSKDNSVYLWSYNSIMPNNTFLDAKSEIMSVAISPNEKLLLAGDKKGMIYLWDIEKGTLINSFEGHKGYLRDVIFSRDSQHFATCGDDKFIKVWLTETQEMSNSYRYHKKWVQTIDISPDNQYLVSGSHDGYVVLMELSSGKIIHKSDKQKNYILSVAFSPKGDQIASTTLNAKRIQVWDASSLNISQDDIEMFDKINSNNYPTPIVVLKQFSEPLKSTFCNLEFEAHSDIPFSHLRIKKGNMTLFEFDDEELKGKASKQDNSFTLKLSQRVLLSKGNNSFSIELGNASGETLEKYSTIVCQPTSGKSELLTNFDESEIVNPPNPYKWAIIFGNEDYHTYQTELDPESDVPFAVNDAKAFRETAISILGVPKENILYYENATYSKMRTAFHKLKNIGKMLGNKMEVYFYYAGHGYPDEATKEPYMIPVDGNGTALEISALNLKDVYDQLTAFKPKKATVFIDACFSGGARQSGLISARGFKVVPKQQENTKNLVVFTASSGTESSLPYKEKKHGLFTYFLTEKIKETKGNISYESLSSYLTETIKVRSVSINNKPQTPQTNVGTEVGDKWKTWKLYEEKTE